MMNLFCCRCAPLACALGVALASPAAGYDLVNWWTSTKTDGGGLQRGDAMTLTWSVVPDGESYSRASNSQVIDYLDDGWGVATADRVPDLTNRAWWDLMRRVYEQFDRTSGLTMVYEPEQTAAGVDTGASGDIRIGGAIIDNDPGGVLADNALPNNGDMRIDVSRNSDGSASFWHSSSAQFRNLISHETGHGVGLGHSDISGANAVMETPLESNFWGLQFDDVYAINRAYGDPLEKNGGNDSAASAWDFGRLDVTASVSIGWDATDSVVGELDSDWVGIDGLSDEDWFRFSTSDVGSLSVDLTPLGPTYSTDQQGPNTDFSARSDLGFELYGDSTGGLSLLAAIDDVGAGETESLLTFPLRQRGDFYLRVTGDTDLNQFYALDFSLSEVTGVAGDVNQDGVLDQLDVDAFVAGWLSDTTGLTQREKTMLGDLNLNGLTDFSDALILQQALFSGGVSASLSFPLAQTPEPTTAALAAACLAPVLRRRRR